MVKKMAVVKPDPKKPDPKYKVKWDWEKKEMLGQGGYGQVYLGERDSDGKIFAVKMVVAKELRNRSETLELESLRNEIYLLSQVRSKYIVRFIGYNLTECRTDFGGRTSLNCFIEYMPGQSLSKLLKLPIYKDGITDEGRIAQYVADILRGVLYLHHNKIVHGDLKGHNILVGPHNLKIADFGGAKFNNVSLSEKLITCTTSCFAAPEVTDECILSYPADIFSVGCTMIQMTTGQRPADDDDELGNNRPFCCVKKIPPTLSSIAQTFLRSCLWKDPSKRGTAAQLLRHPFIVENLDKVNVETLYPQIDPLLERKLFFPSLMLDDVFLYENRRSCYPEPFFFTSSSSSTSTSYSTDVTLATPKAGPSQTAAPLGFRIAKFFFKIDRSRALKADNQKLLQVPHADNDGQKAFLQQPGQKSGDRPMEVSNSRQKGTANDPIVISSSETECSPSPHHAISESDGRAYKKLRFLWCGDVDDVYVPRNLIPKKEQ